MAYFVAYFLEQNGKRELPLRLYIWGSACPVVPERCGGSFCRLVLYFHIAPAFAVWHSRLPAAGGPHTVKHCLQSFSNYAFFPHITAPPARTCGLKSQAPVFCLAPPAGTCGLKSQALVPCFRPRSGAADTNKPALPSPRQKPLPAALAHRTGWQRRKIFR